MNHGRALPNDGHVATGNPMQAFINKGRWLVQCDLRHPQRPVCNSAEFAHRDDRRFFCSDCGNAAVEGAWRPVVWPKLADEIERLLEVRDSRDAQTWNPLIAVGTLAAQNEAARLRRPGAPLIVLPGGSA